MLVCMIVWSESESELGHQLSSILRSKQTNMHTCVSVFVCVWGARVNQRHTRHHRSSRVCAWFLHVRARWHYFANLSTVSVCLPVHTVTHDCVCVFMCHTHTITHMCSCDTTIHTKNTGQYMPSNDWISTLSTLKRSISETRHKHTHRSDERPAKMSDGRADKWLLDK